MAKDLKTKYNTANLKPIRSTSEARERGSKGGKKSGEARAKQKTIKDALQALLNKTYEEDGAKINGYEKIALTAFQKALTGDITAFKEIRDTIGEKPTDKTEHAFAGDFELSIKYEDKPESE